MSTAPKTLILAFGNPGRKDDGLGPALAHTLEAEGVPENVTIDIDYQLTIENAMDVAEHDVVLFVDAATDCSDLFYFKSIEAQDDATFTTHSCSPAGVLYLAQNHFKAKTKAYALGIQGYEWNVFDETLSEKAREGLAAALAFLRPLLISGDFENAITTAG